MNAAPFAPRVSRAEEFLALAAKVPFAVELQPPDPFRSQLYRDVLLALRVASPCALVVL